MQAEALTRACEVKVARLEEAVEREAGGKLEQGVELGRVEESVRRCGVGRAGQGREYRVEEGVRRFRG